MVNRPEAEPQEDVLPFDVEEHQPLDVDEHRLGQPVHEHVLGPKLAVDEPVLRARRHLGRKLAEQGGKLGAVPPDSLVPPGGLPEVRAGPVKDNLLAGAISGKVMRPQKRRPPDGRPPKPRSPPSS